MKFGRDAKPVRESHVSEAGHGEGSGKEFEIAMVNSPGRRGSLQGTMFAAHRPYRNSGCECWVLAARVLAARGAGRAGILWVGVDGRGWGCSADEEEGREGNQEPCSRGWMQGKRDLSR